jgi:hypothetical protein
MTEHPTDTPAHPAGGWRTVLTDGGHASRAQWAFVVGLTVAASMLPLLPRAALLLLAGVGAAVVRCPPWVGVLLVTIAVPVLLFAAVTGSIWYR